MDTRQWIGRGTALGLAVAFAALPLAACTSGSTRVVVPVQKVELADMVDQQVEFTSEMRGPGERGDFITIAGVDIFLDTLSGADRYGQQVTVTGRLRRFQPPTSGEHVGVGAHYWIEDGKLSTPVAPAK